MTESSFRIVPGQDYQYNTAGGRLRGRSPPPEHASEPSRRPGKRAIQSATGTTRMNTTLSGQSVVHVIKDQVSCDLGGEAAILHVRKGMYYGLDPVGARVWELLQQPRSVQEIKESLLKEFEVEP